MEISTFQFPNTLEDIFSFSSPDFNTLMNNNTNNNNNNKRLKTKTNTNDQACKDNNTPFSYQEIVKNLDLFQPQIDQEPLLVLESLTNTNTNTSPLHMDENELSPAPLPKRVWPDGGEDALNQPKSEEQQSADTAQGGGGSSSWHSQRRLWVKTRSKAWWEQCDGPDFPDDEFKKCFRMSKATFDVICKELEPIVNKKDTMLRLAIPVRQRVAVCIWRLATGEPLREVSKRFGLGISTCHKLVLEVCKAIQDVLRPAFLNWPDENNLAEIKKDFEMMSGIPNVAGSLYTTHIPIIAPKDRVAAYFNKKHTERNQKTSYSVSVQGVVDSRGIFTDLSIGWPGSMPDDKVLEKSSLFYRANMGLLKDVILIGNSGHPLLDWVLVPYPQAHLTWTQHAFNEKVLEVQKVAKEAFMRLKARWSCLQKRTEMKLQDLPIVLMACCVLHNVCEMNHEDLSPELRFELFDDEMISDQKVVKSSKVSQYRDQIAHKLLHHNLAATSFQ